MASITITIPESLEAEFAEAILAYYDNPDGLSAGQLAKKGIKQHLREILNHHRRQTAMNAITPIEDVELDS